MQRLTGSTASRVGPLLMVKRHFPVGDPLECLHGVNIDVDIDAMPTMGLKAVLKVTKVKCLTARVAHG